MRLRPGTAAALALAVLALAFFAARSFGPRASDAANARGAAAPGSGPPTGPASVHVSALSSTTDAPSPRASPPHAAGPVATATSTASAEASDLSGDEDDADLPHGKIAGVVRDHAGRPLRGAWVAALHAGVAIPDDPFGSGVGDVQTDESGRFEVMASAGRRIAMAVCKGYASAASEPVDVTANATVTCPDIVLERRGLGRLHVTLLDPAGRPVRGEVELALSTLESAEGTPSRGTDMGSPDASGAMEFEATLGTYEVEAIVNDVRSRRETVTVAEGATSRVTLTIEIGPALRVHVVDDETGRPVPGVDITVEAAGSPSADAPTTDASGDAFVHPAPPAGRAELTWQAEGYSGFAGGGVRELFGRGRAISIQVDAAALAGALELRLLRGPGISGRVLRHDGAPAAGATVYVRDDGEGGDATRVSAGPDGAFRATGLGSRFPLALEVVATAPGCAWAVAHVHLTASDPRAEVELRLAPAATLEGIVRGPDGLPVTGARVQAVPHDGGDAPPGLFESNDLDEDPLAGRRAIGVADANGAYRLDGLAAGTVAVLAGAPGFSPVVRRGVEVVAGSTARADLTLGPTLSISGRVVDAAGQPAGEGASVVAEGAAARRKAKVDAAGRFIFTDLPAGEYGLSVRTDRGSAEREDIAAGSADVVLAIPPLGRISGRVAIPAGGPAVVKIQCSMHRDHATSGRSARVDGDGRFVVEAVDLETDRIELRARGYVPFVVEAPRIQAGETLELSVSLVRGGTVAGHVIGVDGKPAPLALVVAPGGLRAASAATDAEGAFRIEDLPPGTPITLRVRPYPGTPPHDAATVTLAPGQVVDDLVIRVDATPPAAPPADEGE